MCLMFTVQILFAYVISGKNHYTFVKMKFYQSVFFYFWMLLCVHYNVENRFLGKGRSSYKNMTDFKCYFCSPLNDLY